MPAIGSFVLRMGPPMAGGHANTSTIHTAARADRDLRASLDALVWPPAAGIDRTVHRVDGSADGIDLAARWQGSWHSVGDDRVGAIALAVEPGEQAPRPLLDAWMNRRELPVEHRRGRFCVVAWDRPGRRLMVATDAMRTWPVSYVVDGDAVWVASDARLLIGAGAITPKLSLDAVYHYLNFSFVPTGSAIHPGLRKLAGGERLRWQAGRIDVDRWWRLRYPEDIQDDDATAAAALRERIQRTVPAHRPQGDERWGAFLSGGTDSSSICGMLARANQPDRVSSFSIGFAEPGYDELGYARIASDHFGLDAHERRVGEQDAADALPKLVEAFDEPFGNASAIPTYFCATMAAEAGVSHLIAGDGGDEIFGGNERYRKDRIFSWFHDAPAPLRMMGGWIAGAVKPLDQRWSNRICNFVERGSLPNPDRFYTDDSFASDQYDSLLTPAFRAAVTRDASLDLQRGVWQGLTAPAELHRLMHLDLTMAIADNDLVKVTGACRLAGVSVGFPYLDRELIEYTARLPARHKLRGLDKRALFKQAMSDTLPEAIRKKRKQGFGLPISVWMRNPGRFHDLLNDTLGSQRARSRGWFEPAAIEGLLSRHQRGAWDHANELYLLLVLELWQQRFMDQTDG